MTRLVFWSQWLRSLCALIPGRSPRRSRKPALSPRQHRASLRVEGLEERMALSSGPFFNTQIDLPSVVVVKEGQSAPITAILTGFGNPAQKAKQAKQLAPNNPVLQNKLRLASVTVGIVALSPALQVVGSRSVPFYYDWSSNFNIMAPNDGDAVHNVYQVTFGAETYLAKAPFLNKTVTVIVTDKDSREPVPFGDNISNGPSGNPGGLVPLEGGGLTPVGREPIGKPPDETTTSGPAKVSFDDPSFALKGKKPNTAQQGVTQITFRVRVKNNKKPVILTIDLEADSTFVFKKEASSGNVQKVTDGLSTDPNARIQGLNVTLGPGGNGTITFESTAAVKGESIKLKVTRVQPTDPNEKVSVEKDRGSAQVMIVGSGE